VGVAKPGYQKFTYPHPLRTAGPGRDAVGGAPARFELRTVDAAGLAAADFDRDGGMDIAFAEMHQGADPDEVGVLLNRSPEHPWEKVVVSTTGSHGLQVLEVDGDGDLDLLGNVEEHYHRGLDGKDVSWFSVVWFENPSRQP
jgi:hypothetical protein